MTDVVSVAQRQLAELFDNEAIWDAEDTDDYIVKTVNEFEKVLNIPVSHMRDLGQNSLLHMASIWNRPKVMEALIRCGAELNEKNMVRIDLIRSMIGKDSELYVDRMDTPHLILQCTMEI